MVIRTATAALIHVNQMLTWGSFVRRMSVSMDGVVKRDEMIFRHALVHKCPISMVLSGGYAAKSHQAVAASIANLLTTFDLTIL